MRIGKVQLHTSTDVDDERRKAIDRSTKMVAEAKGLKKKDHAPTIWDLLCVNGDGKGDGCDNNCQRCVTAGEMNARGYDCIATTAPYVEHDTLAKLVRKPKSSIHEFGYLMFKNPDPVMYSSKAYIERKMAEWGNGARAIVSCKLKGIGAHVFMAVRSNGNTYFIDPQVGEMWDFGETDLSHGNDGNDHYNTFARIDNLEFTRAAFKCVAPKAIH